MLLHQGLMEFHTKFIKRIPDYVSFFFKFWNVRSQRVKHHCNGKMQRKLIPKSKAPSKNSISDFLPIALLNTEGKLFFSLISKRLESHQSNKIMNLSGYCKHLSIVWSVLKKARSKKSSAASIWLDIANVYGSILHELIFFALQRYGIPNKWMQIVESYYVWICSKSFSKSATSSWHRHERGIFAGCTISIILFLAGINVILKYSLPTNVPKFVINNNPLPLVRAFMDNLNLLCSSVSGAKTFLHRCTKALKWAGLDFQADKSSSTAIIKVRSMNTTTFSVSERKTLLTFLLIYLPFKSAREIYIPKSKAPSKNSISDFWQLLS